MTTHIDLNDRGAWDDRALIDGWDAAQEEYNVRTLNSLHSTNTDAHKLYHSVQASGENILHYLDRDQLESLKE